MNNKLNEFIQLSQKVECAKLIKRRMEAHTRVVTELKKAVDIGNINPYKAWVLAQNIKNLQEELTIQMDCIQLFVLPENIYKIKELEDKSIQACNEIEKSIV